VGIDWPSAEDGLRLVDAVPSIIDATEAGTDRSMLPSQLSERALRR
jgi:hypothetical protein